MNRRRRDAEQLEDVHSSKRPYPESRWTDVEGPPHVVVIGGGFTGLSAAYEISRRGIPVTVLEKDEEIGGLAASFQLNGQQLEKFYHHWFNTDHDVIRLMEQLHCQDKLIRKPTTMGTFVGNEVYHLSTPLDLLRFKPLSLLNRLRLGSLLPAARRVKNWKSLESLTAREWLLTLCGPQVYKLVWEPLLRGKFGPYASEISAVWFWNKLLLRGRSRGKTGKEVLLYYEGGFAAFAKRLADEIRTAGGVILTGTAAQKLIVEDGRVTGVQTSGGVIRAQAVAATVPLPVFADLVEPYVPCQYVEKLKEIKYLANVCLVLELLHSLSDIYWLNVNDPDFPFVGLIEHTNFQSADGHEGTHIVYLSKYFPRNAELCRFSDEQVFEFAAPYVKRIFPEFDRSWVRRYYVWRAEYAQPVVGRHHSRLIPSRETPIEGLYLATMAQIYPEDRGTNYAIREGRRVGRAVACSLTEASVPSTTQMAGMSRNMKAE
ncbi:MAG: NAD(P)/FAD-dependent oxidoreductase [Planctomycetota bacterium]